MYAKEKGILPQSEVYFNIPSNNAKKLFFYIVCAGHFIYENDYILKRENYNSFLIMYVINGKLTVFYENKTYSAAKGDIVFLNCYKEHGYKSEGNLETVWFHFDGNISKEYFNMIYDSIGCVISNKSYILKDEILEIFEACKKEAINEFEIFSQICKILSGLYSVCQNNYLKQNSMKEIIEYINSNYAKEITIKDLAKKIMISEYHFIRMFKKEIGYTPHEYIIKTKINNAKIMLKSSNLTIKEIAYKCGFSSESAFSNCFKKNTGMTALEFRNAAL